MAGTGIITRTVQRLSGAGRGFRDDQRGNVAIMVGLLAMPMLAAVGVAVDMGETHRGKVNFQAALDAGALAAAKSFARGKTENEAANAANRVFQANINATLPGSTGTISMSSSASDCTGDGIVATGTLKHPIFFGKVHKVFQQTHPGHAFLQGSTTVKCGAKTVEIALVLDNSGSMGWDNKLGTLKNASKSLVDTVFNSMSASPYPQPVKFSLVPFASTVNVGSNNRTAAWMDTTGRSSIHHENFNWDEDPIALKQGDRYKNKNNGEWLTRFTLYDEMRIDWDGCVESRADPYFVTDDAPTPTNPDTLIVPSFAPDSPDNWSGYTDRIEAGTIRHIYCTRWSYSNDYGYYCTRWSNGSGGYRHPETGRRPNYYSADYGYRGVWQNGEYQTGGYTNGSRINEETYLYNYIADNHNFAASGKPEVLAREHTGTAPAGKERQHKRMYWTWKYFNRPSINYNAGSPNSSCTTQALTPLSTSRSLIKSKLDQMQAVGGTNVQQGAIWGWRSLSSTEPLSEGREYGRRDNKKVMILLTDGQNTYRSLTDWGDQISHINKSDYRAFGQQLNGRMFASYTDQSNPRHDSPTYTKAMDFHLKRTCENVKSSGVQIYSIAFNVPNGSSVKDMLEFCASSDAGGKLYYDASNNAALVKAFQSIAEKLAELAITK